MKKILVIVFLLCAVRAEAFVDPGFDGQSAYQERDTYYPNIGGGGGQTRFNQGDGIASHFDLQEDLFITDVKFLGHRQDLASEQETAFFDLIFYSYSIPAPGFPQYIVPDTTSAIYTKHYEFQEEDGFTPTEHTISGINFELKKGKYWLAYENGNTGTVASTASAKFQTTSTPEPATMLLFTLGTLGAIYARRRRGYKLSSTL